MKYPSYTVRLAPHLLLAFVLSAFSLSLPADTDLPKEMSPERVAHVYIATNNVEGIERLMRQGLDVHETHYFGWSPLYAAARMGRVEIVRTMLENGGSPSFRQAPEDSADPNSLPLLAE